MTQKVEATQHFTQPLPRYSEASLVKRMEELGIGRPSTYASIIQVLKDREYVRIEKNRFYAEEKGRLVTAFLERFFERYVDYNYTAGLEGSLDDISAGTAEYKDVLRAFWADFLPLTAEVIEAKPWDIDKALDEHLGPHLFPDKGEGDPRACPSCGDGRLSLRNGKFGAYISCSNYPECRYTRQFAGNGGEGSGPEVMGDDPVSGLPVSIRSGRFGRYVQLGEGEAPKRASIPKDVAEGFDLAMALKLLALPRDVGMHPETGKPIKIGRAHV